LRVIQLALYNGLQHAYIHGVWCIAATGSALDKDFEPAQRIDSVSHPIDPTFLSDDPPECTKQVVTADSVRSDHSENLVWSNKAV
jgi:hypothetical protein